MMSLYTLMTNTTAEIFLKEGTLSEVKAYLSERGLVAVEAADLQIVVSGVTTNSEYENKAIEAFCDVLHEFY